MSKSLPTVAVNRGGHMAIINESDFDPSLDTLWSADHAKEQPQGLRRGDEIEAPQAEETKVAIAPIEARLAELQAMAEAGDWRSLKVEAEAHGITRPADGWDAAVLPILVAEYGQAAAEDAFTEPD